MSTHQDVIVEQRFVVKALNLSAGSVGFEKNQDFFLKLSLSDLTSYSNWKSISDLHFLKI
jgi:hypothetical protein